MTKRIKNYTKKLNVTATSFILFSADDMGLGKTLSMLSLVVASKNDPESKEWLSHPPAREGGYNNNLSTPTLSSIVDCSLFLFLLSFPFTLLSFLSRFD